MNCKNFIFLIVTVISAQSNVLDKIKELRIPMEPAQYAKILLSLSVPDSIVGRFLKQDCAGLSERMNGSKKTIPLFTQHHFVRSESFTVNLDLDTGTEYVSQVVFETGDQKTDTRVYFIFINDDKAHNFVLFKFLLFEELLCDLGNPNPVAFSFVPSIKGAFKQVQFNLNRAESCGDEIYYYQRTDTLSIINSEALYTSGSPFNIQSSNRMELLNDMED